MTVNDTDSDTDSDNVTGSAVNDRLDTWDRAHFMHPSTPLGQFARGEAPNRIIEGGEGCHKIGRAHV